MAPKWPRVLLTTSRNPSDQTRIFIKFLHHIFPNSLIMHRGNANIETIHAKAREENCDFVYLAFSKENRLGMLKIYSVSPHGLQDCRVNLKFIQYIDHKIFGFHSLPETGPISTNVITRKYHPELLDYFEKYWFLEYGKKTPLWFALDVIEGKKTCYVSIIDALTQKKLLFAEVELVNKDE